MIPFFANLVFLNPWVLAGLAVLPALWFLLRIMPPSPRRIVFPAAHFLSGLVPDTHTTKKTPWWILLLRLLIVLLVITAFAQPVLNPSQDLQDSKAPLYIIVDNGWSSADLWDTKLKTAQDMLAQAQRSEREVFLSTTAPEADNNTPLTIGVLSAAEALARIKGFAPRPWPADYRALADTIESRLQDYSGNGAIEFVILSEGIGTSGFNVLLKTLRQHGSAHVYTPDNLGLPMLIELDRYDQGNPVFTISAPEDLDNTIDLSLQAIGHNGQTLGIENFTFPRGDRKTDVMLQLPDMVQRDLTRVQLSGHRGAGSVYIFGDQFQKKRVGLVSPVQDDGAIQPYIEAEFYLSRALEPYADLNMGELDDILGLAQSQATNATTQHRLMDYSMLILPDISAFSPTQLEALDDWVNQGGLLLRFAGETMQQEAVSRSTEQSYLLPAPLRPGKRATDGALSWEGSPKLQAFTDISPLSDLGIQDDIIVRGQLLAQPSADLPDKTWAVLDDGTPLITAEYREKGLIVMVHTTASPSWSNLPLSGVFVQILHRLVTIAGRPPESLQDMDGLLDPLRIVDGFGSLTQPEDYLKSIHAQDLAKATPSVHTPPGIYGKSSLQYVMNIGDRLSIPRSLPDYIGNSHVTKSLYGTSYEVPLMQYLLFAALLLFLLDWSIITVLRSHFRGLRRTGLQASILLLFIAFGGVSVPAYALEDGQSTESGSLRYANGVYLGFIQSKNPSVNTVTRRGLEVLSQALTQRTSVEPDGVVALNPETDTLSFFPLIYWPVDASDAAPLSEAALRNVQSYLDHGGTILFDTREASITSDPLRGGENAKALSTMTRGLNIPALTPIGNQHVLGKSFYLLNPFDDPFPGRYTGGTLWIERNSAQDGSAQKNANGRDGVSSVLIGNHDWAFSWANSEQDVSNRRYISRYQQGSARQREIAIRFGVNLMMYALTGNYKADQLHMKHILKRMGTR